MKRETTLVASVIAAITASLCCLGPIVAAVVGLGSFGAAAVFETWRPYLLGVTFGLLGLGFYFTYRKQEVHCADRSVCATRPSVGRWNKILLWLATGLVIAFATFPYYSGAVWRFLLTKGETQAITDPAAPGDSPSRSNEFAVAGQAQQPSSPAEEPQTSSPKLAAESARDRGAVRRSISASKTYGGTVQRAGSASKPLAANSPSTTAAIRNPQDVPALTRATIEIQGMHCAGCAVNVEQALKRLPGVKAVVASYEKGQAVVEYDPAKVKPEQLKAAIDGIGYKVGAVHTAQP
ncbi:Copper chaperone CopZ [bacterium HR08]|nr:Copper chaperone CopZ [bacterium HR08]